MLEFLGTGTSTGVPVPGCGCRVCRSRDPHDNRLRASALIRHGGRALVIDTGPEFRIQCLRAGVTRLDAVLLTHDHADHLNGFDDVRPYSAFRRRTLPVWCSARTERAVRRRFDYIWNAPQRGGGVPDVDIRVFRGAFEVMGLRVVPIPVRHGCLDIFGFRIGDLAYMTDVSSLPDASRPLLDGVRTLVVGCVRQRPHPTHLNLAGVGRLHRLVRPERTLLTHIGHYLSHKDCLALAPADVLPAHDGMRVELAV